MNTLLEIYNFIDELEKEIGDCCRVMLFKAFDDTFAIQINWPDDFHYRRALTTHELKYMGNDNNIKYWKNWFIEDVKTRYRVATVGEELGIPK